MPKYRIKVTEVHCDFVWVDAPHQLGAIEEAKDIAECIQDGPVKCEIIQEWPDKETESGTDRW